MVDLSYRLDVTYGSRLVGWPEYERLVELLTGRLDPEGWVVAAVLKGGAVVAESLADRWPAVPLWHVAAGADGVGGELFVTETVDGVVRQVRPRGHRMLLVDEVVDSGRTMAHLTAALRRAGVAEVVWCAVFATDGHAHPVVRAARLEAGQVVVLPWRVERDFAGTARALLAAGGRTSAQLQCHLGEQGHPILLDRLEGHLHRLRDGGHVHRVQDRWEWRS